MQNGAPDTERRSEESTLSASNKITIGSAISVFLVMIPVLVFVIRMDVRQEAQSEQMKEVRTEQRSQGEQLAKMNERLLRIELRDGGSNDKVK